MPTGQLGPYNGLTWNWDDYDALTNPRGLGKGGYREETGLKLLFASHDADIAVGFQMSAADSLAIATGTKIFTPAVMRGVPVGAYLLALFDKDNWMYGQITAKDTLAGTVTLNVTQVAGSGTRAVWTLQPSSPQAPPAAEFNWAGLKTSAYALLDRQAIKADTAGGAFAVTVAQTSLVAEVSKFKIIKRGGNQLTLTYGTVKFNGVADDAEIPAEKIGTLVGTYVDATEGYALEFRETSIGS
jgi:hypothetical protein